jgi:origin recognition complex subunit 6
LESIITPRGKLTDDAWVLANLVPVLGAVYLYVWRGVTWPGRAMDQAVYVKFRKDLAGTLAQARGHVKLPEVEGGEEEDGWKGWKDGVGIKEFDTAALRGNRHGWFDMDWVMGVHDLVMREMDAEDGEGGQEEEDEEQEVVVGQARRPDTMFQERYDYLSERKRKAYADWKEGVLKRIRELEKGS